LASHAANTLDTRVGLMDSKCADTSSIYAVMDFAGAAPESTFAVFTSLLHWL
jgi:hypothetical protein